MGFDQYHEPPEELSEETRAYAGALESLIEEAVARVVMNQAQKDEFISELTLSFYCSEPRLGAIF